MPEPNKNDKNKTAKLAFIIVFATLLAIGLAILLIALIRK